MTTSIRHLIAILLFLHIHTLKAQQDGLRVLPKVKLTSLSGASVLSSDFLNKQGLTVLNFWATWCKPCVLELNTIKDLYPEWKKELNIKIVAVTIDDSRNTPKVAPLVNGKGWEYEVYMDSNSDFKRALNVNNIPHTFILNPAGEILWQHNSYAPGDEDELHEMLRKLSAGK